MISNIIIDTIDTQYYNPLYFISAIPLAHLCSCEYNLLTLILPKYCTECHNTVIDVQSLQWTIFEELLQYY